MTVPPLDYPCPYPIKVFLRPDSTVEAALAERVRGELAPGAGLEIERQPSSKGGYVCLTLRFDVQSASHAERVADAVRTSDGVLMAI